MKTRIVELNGGRKVSIIDYRETQGPDEGFLKCTNCGEVVKETRRSYESQSEHRGCVKGISGQSMMGHGWGGWKRSRG